MFVRNPAGTVHSVPDDFYLPDEKWTVVSEAEASAQLLGQEADPAVTAVELHNGSDQPVIDESGPAQEPGDVPEQESNDVQPSVPNPDVDVQPAAEPAEEASA